MLNRGYALLPYAAPHIDYLLGEAMASRWNFTARKYEMVSSEDWNWQAAQLRSAKRANPSLVVTTLDYWNPEDTETVASLYARARSQGFEPYVSTLDLNRRAGAAVMKAWAIATTASRSPDLWFSA